MRERLQTAIGKAKEAETKLKNYQQKMMNQNEEKDAGIGGDLQGQLDRATKDASNYRFRWQQEKQKVEKYELHNSKQKS